MPQASDEDRARWGGRDGIGEEKAMDYLESRGFRLTRQWHWIKPDGHIMTDDDWGAINFLIDEWDFGGLAPVD